MKKVLIFLALLSIAIAIMVFALFLKPKPKTYYQLEFYTPVGANNVILFSGARLKMGTVADIQDTGTEAYEVEIVQEGKVVKKQVTKIQKPQDDTSEFVFYLNVENLKTGSVKISNPEGKIIYENTMENLASSAPAQKTTSQNQSENLTKNQVLDINLHYKDNQIALNSIDKRQGFLPDYLNQPSSGYALQILDKDSKELFKAKFNFPLQVISEGLPNQGTGGSVKNLSEVDKTITVPSSENAQKLLVLDPDGNQLLEHNLAPLVDPNLSNRGATKTSNPNLIIIALAVAMLIAAAGMTIFYLKTRKGLPQ